MNDVVTKRSGAVLVVQINRPDVFNALNKAVLTGLNAAVLQAAATPGVRSVVLTGTGPKAFSAGADLKEPPWGPTALVTRWRSASGSCGPSNRRPCR